MPNNVTQALFLGSLLEGLKFTVEEVTPLIPDRTGWGASFTNGVAGKTSIDGAVRS